jgi:uncharacterized protein (DUF2141 family)
MYSLHTRMWIPPTLLGMFLSLISSSASTAQTPPASVTVNVNGLRSPKGNVVVCLWRQQEKDFPVCSSKAAFQSLSVKPTDTTASVTFQAVPPGEYAISAFLDENTNGTLDRNFMGMPKEPIGLSNMSPNRSQPQGRSRPSFDKSKFTVNGAKTIALSLMYFGR